MGCGSCGGSRSVTAAVAGGSTRTRQTVVARGEPVKYVWAWTSHPGREKYFFEGEQEALAFSAGKSGYLTVVPATQDIVQQIRDTNGEPVEQEEQDNALVQNHQ